MRIDLDSYGSISLSGLVLLALALPFLAAAVWWLERMPDRQQTPSGAN